MGLGELEKGGQDLEQKFGIKGSLEWGEVELGERVGIGPGWDWDQERHWDKGGRLEEPRVGYPTLGGALGAVGTWRGWGLGLGWGCVGVWAKVVPKAGIGVGWGHHEELSALLLPVFHTRVEPPWEFGGP